MTVFHTHLLPHYHAKQLRQDGKKYYVDPRGVRLPSVTTILNMTKPQADRESLARWRERVGFAEASRISRTASNRGTGTHKQIKNYLLGKEVSCSEAVEPYWSSLGPVLEEVDQVRLVESSVFHYDLAYAGKVDCVISYRGTPCICDWKTSDKPKQSVERLYDGPLQLAAYCGAVNHFYQEQEIGLKHALLVVAIANQPAEIFWFEPEQVIEYWQQWISRLGEFYRLGARF